MTSTRWTVMLSALSSRQFRARFDALANDPEHLFTLFAFNRQARRAHPLCAEAALLDHQFDILHKFRHGIEAEEREKNYEELMRRARGQWR